MFNRRLRSSDRRIPRQREQADSRCRPSRYSRAPGTESDSPTSASGRQRACRRACAASPPPVGPSMSHAACQPGLRTNSNGHVGGDVALQQKLAWPDAISERGVAGRVARGVDRGDAGRELLAPFILASLCPRSAPKMRLVFSNVALLILAARGSPLPSSIQNAHSFAGTMISAFGKASEPSGVRKPLMWSPWKCEIMTMSIDFGSTPAAARLSGSEAGAGLAAARARCRCRSARALGRC